MIRPIIAFVLISFIVSTVILVPAGIQWGEQECVQVQGNEDCVQAWDWPHDAVTMTGLIVGFSAGLYAAIRLRQWEVGLDAA